jgi:hypothetical protein
MPDSGSPPTPGELARSLRDLLVRFDQLFARVEQNYVTKEVHAVQLELLKTQNSGTSSAIEAERELRKTEHAEINRRIKGLEDGPEVSRRLAALEDAQRWLIRTVGGIVIAAVITAAIASRSVVGQ